MMRKNSSLLAKRKNTQKSWRDFTSYHKENKPCESLFFNNRIFRAKPSDYCKIKVVLNEIT